MAAKTSTGGGGRAVAPAQSPLAQTAATGTDFWNDSCAIAELEYAISHGAVGATSNPIIVAQVVKQEMSRWKPRIAALAAELPTAGEEEIAWALNEEMAVGASKLLLPVFERHRGTKGRLSIQTNPTFYRNSKAMLEQALHFHSLAPNVHVKIPATAAGIETVEEATARGVSVNATVSFTVPQALAVAGAVERGLVRAAAAGIDTATMAPTCTIMVGRVDDWLKVIAEKDDVIVDPEALEWAGVAVMKRAYTLYRERGYRTRLLAAAYRNHYHWSAFVGGDLSMTIPYRWQLRFNASDVAVRRAIDDPIPSGVVETLRAHFPDFVKAYEPDAMAVRDFDSYGATVRTLRSFIAGYRDLLATVRDIVLPNPDG